MLFKGRLFSFIALLMTASIPSKQSIQGLNSKCNVSPDGNGDKAAVICSFGEDISKLRREFEIIHYGKDRIETTVLICLWHFEKPECITNKKYKFRGNITDTVKVDIDNPTEEYTGDYVCYDLSAEPGSYESCRFSHEESKPTSAPISYSTLTKLVIKGPEMIGDPGEKNTTLYASVILAVIVGILIIVIAIGIYFYRKKLTKSHTRESMASRLSQKTSEEMETSFNNRDDSAVNQQEESNHDHDLSSEDQSINPEENNCNAVSNKTPFIKQKTNMTPVKKKV